jgi:hypothetical protein
MDLAAVVARNPYLNKREKGQVEKFLEEANERGEIFLREWERLLLILGDLYNRTRRFQTMARLERQRE